MREERLRPLMKAFADAIASHAALSQIFGVI
jgi:hypothetical protein